MEPTPEPRPAGERLLRLITSHNPFYVISAALILYGLFASGEWSRDIWPMLAALGGYTLLMALAGVLIIRWGRVWDDARSVVLLVVLLLLAISVGYDNIAVASPFDRVPPLLVGLGLAIGLSELLLRGAGIRLHVAARLPYHLTLTLFFLYPVALTAMVEVVDGRNKQWLALLLYAWSPLAGLIALSLIPAARMGSRLAQGSGTPWRWPVYPWVVFGLLGVAAAARSWLLGVAYYTGGADPFGAYLLAPLILAVGLVLLECGLLARHRGLQTLAWCAPLVAIACSFPGTNGNATRQEMLRHLLAFGAGSPLWLASIASIAFYLLGWARGLRRAEPGLVAALALLALSGPDTVAVAQLLSRPTQLVPLLVAGGYLLLSLAWSPYGWRALLAVACLLWAACGVTPPGMDAPWLAPAQHGLEALALLTASLLTIGLVFDDAFGRLALRLATPALVVTFGGALFAGASLAPTWHVVVRWAFVAALSFAPLVLGLLVNRPALVRVQALFVALLLVRGGVATVALHTSEDLSPSVIPLLWSGVFFVLGLAISLAKRRRGERPGGGEGNGEALAL